jgi:retron-type reverse transcriptase
LKSDILGEDRQLRESSTGAPQARILSPLLSNIALSVLDEYFAKAWAATGDSHDRQQRRRKGLASYRLVRYADLSRTPNKSAYAEDRIMPRTGRKGSCLVGTGDECSA